ncbi:protein DGS1, mitochondrial [Artemisia annua]|uniref:Protein DGS1, mitochondrial n=1 Tax=Artemisia annua TaxID=35608 RepID=A0A2U1L329_ARTAN|nr:protein DGS1, mitochondrial [Artemisia annua]
MHIFLVDIAFSLQNEHGHYVNGLVLYTLDRLYKAVERHAKAYGEWSRVRDDLTSLGDPCLETSDKLHVISVKQGMWKFKIAKSGDPWLRTTKNHIGHQIWEFDPTLGSVD